MIRSLTVALFATSLLCAPALAQSVSPAITAAVADAGRPAADKERDATRKPAETVAFAGVKPGMTIAELGPGRGYYTRILAKAVGPKGKVFAVVTSAQAARPGALDALNALTADYPNIKVVTVDYASMSCPRRPTCSGPRKIITTSTTDRRHRRARQGGVQQSEAGRHLLCRRPQRRARRGPGRHLSVPPHGRSGRQDRVDRRGLQAGWRGRSVAQPGGQQGGQQFRDRALCQRPLHAADEAPLNRRAVCLTDGSPSNSLA